MTAKTSAPKPAAKRRRKPAEPPPKPWTLEQARSLRDMGYSLEYITKRTGHTLSR
ncbi:MAG: hypothetical protein NVS3B1_06270 [Marmoricola sp.]